MKTQEKSDREQAIEWWNGLNDLEKMALCRVYFSMRSVSGISVIKSLTDREIEQIWRKETQQELERGIVITREERPQVDFEMFNQLQHKRVEFGQIYLSAKEMDNIKLFFELLSKSSTFAHKAHKELNKLMK